MVKLYRSLSLCWLLSGLFMGGACQNGNSASTPDKPVVIAPKDSFPVADSAYLLGKIDPASRPDFVEVKAPYTDKPGSYLRKETYDAFVKMFEAAQKDGIRLRIISATRTFNQQKGIWEEKWARWAKETPEPDKRSLRILEYSAMPGASRHHWGTDIDLNDLNNRAFEPGGAYAKVYEWLTTHAHEYGFCQPYTALDDNRPNGYHEERWHWSYLPLSKPFLQQYLQFMDDGKFSGFKGSETAPAIQVVQHYAAGINQDCYPK